MLCFAYGSNMDWERMRERCSTARYVCNVNLEDHRLIFPRKSKHWKCGVASVCPSDGGEVWGVVYQINELDIGALDSSEGYDSNRPPDQNSYYRKGTRVLRDGDKEQPLTVWTYVANAQPHPPPPSAEYKRVIVDAAKHWQLPKDYISRLERIETRG